MAIDRTADQVVELQEAQAPRRAFVRDFARRRPLGAVGDGLHEQEPEPVEIEHLLGDDEASEQERELEPDHGHDR